MYPITLDLPDLVARIDLAEPAADVPELAGVTVRALGPSDVDLVVAGTGTETAPSMWGPRPAGPYTAGDATAALALWQPARGQVTFGAIAGGRLLACVGVAADGECCYWVRPEERGHRLSAHLLRLFTRRAHRAGAPGVWLEIDPANTASLRTAERAGYRYTARLAGHCRRWEHEDERRDTRHDCLIFGYPEAGPGPADAVT